MSIGTFGETSLRGEMKIFRKNHGPSVLLKSASTLVISNDDKLLFSQDGWAPLCDRFGSSRCWDLFHARRGVSFAEILICTSATRCRISSVSSSHLLLYSFHESWGSAKIRVANRVIQTLWDGWASDMQPCSETWEMGIALVWILKVNFYKLGFLGSDHTVLLPFFPARLGWIDG